MYVLIRTSCNETSRGLNCSNLTSTMPNRSAPTFTILSGWIWCLEGASRSSLLHVLIFSIIFYLQSTLPLNVTLICTNSHSTLLPGYMKINMHEMNSELQHPPNFTLLVCFLPQQMTQIKVAFLISTLSLYIQSVIELHKLSLYVVLKLLPLLHYVYVSHHPISSAPVE